MFLKHYDTMTSRNRNLVLGRVLLEFLVLNLSLFLVIFTSKSVAVIRLEQEVLFSSALSLFLLFNIGWILIIIMNGDADYYLDNSLQKKVKSLSLNALILVGIVYTVSNLFQIVVFHQTILLFSILLFLCLDIIFTRLEFSLIRGPEKVDVNSHILIIGNRGKWGQWTQFTEKAQNEGYQVLGFLSGQEAPSSLPDFRVNGQISHLPKVLEDNPVDEIFIKVSSLEEEEVKQAIKTADYYGVRVNLVTETPNFLAVDYNPSTTFDNHLVLQLRKSPLDQFNYFLLKKTFDLFFALAVLILLSPLFVLIAFLISLDGRGTIFYCPLRKGEKGALFKCYKFRTMSICDDPVTGQKSTVANDPRITWIGKFLRKYDLDELPQFYNVLKGDMSVVGPRPHRVFLKNDFRKIVNEYMVRHYVKPGITGWAQVNGWRGPTKTPEQKRERVKYDLWYIGHWSFWLDIKIIFLTVFGRKTRKNAF